VRRVHRNQAGVRYVVNLSRSLQRVAIYKATSLGRVRVQVEIELQVSHLVVVQHHRSTCEYRWVHIDVWIVIETIQVQTMNIRTIMATFHSVWIQHWNHLENKLLTESTRSRIVLVQNEI